MSGPTTRRVDGFTLMELLVALVITAFLVTMLFQSVAVFQRAQARADAWTADARRTALFEGWYRDAAAGLVPIKGEEFQGEALRWRGLTLQPPSGGGGAPSRVEWTLVPVAGGTGLRYAAAGATSVTLPMPVGTWRFTYFDADGRQYSAWPPPLGLHADLPMAIALQDQQGDRLRLYATILGPRKPSFLPFEAGEE